MVQVERDVLVALTSRLLWHPPHQSSSMAAPTASDIGADMAIGEYRRFRVASPLENHTSAHQPQTIGGSP
jgi:hypothetical protein